MRSPSETATNVNLESVGVNFIKMKQKCIATVFTALAGAFGAQGAETTFGFYTAKEDVEQHRRVDLDVAAMSNATGFGDFASAKLIYESGMNSFKSEISKRNIAAFSTELEGKAEGLKNSNGDLILSEFYLFKNYYGSSIYAHQLVTDALDGTGSAAGFDTVVRKELAVKGAQYQSVFMYVLYEFAKAIYLCTIGENGQLNWDEGAAFFVGSLIDANGKGSGQLLYTLAEKRCTSFGTCNGNGDNEPISSANVEAIKAMNAGRKALESKSCSEASKQYQIIKKQMQIPLIQGMLLYAYESDAANGGSLKDMAEGWSFAAAVLPFIDEVDENAASLIRSNMELKSGSTQTVQDGYKRVFEESYKILADLCISCEEIGVNNFASSSGKVPVPMCTTDKQVYESACADYLLGQGVEDDKNDVNVGLVVGVCVGALLVLVLIGYFIYRLALNSEDENKVKDQSGQTKPVDGNQEAANSDADNVARV